MGLYDVDEEKRKAIRTAIMRATDTPIWNCDKVFEDSLIEAGFKVIKIAERGD